MIGFGFPRRLGAAMYALWFGFAMTEPVPLHACPMHSRVVLPAELEGARCELPDDAKVQRMADSLRDAAGDGPANIDPGQSHECQCIGQCCGASQVALPVVEAELAGETILVFDTGPSGRAAAIQTAPDHLLPFATAPPRA